VVTEGNLAMQPEKIRAINDWKVPKDVTEVQAFMGTSRYYRRFVKDFSLSAASLSPDEEGYYL